jgi:hypothetical protein
MVDIIIHHDGKVQHNPRLTYIGGLMDEIKNYDTDFLSVWEIEDVVKDLGYVNDLHYWHKFVEYRVDVPIIIAEVPLLLPLEGVDDNGHENDHVEGLMDHAEGDVDDNDHAEGDVGQAERDVGTKPSKKKEKKKVVSSKKVTKSKGAKPSKKKKKGSAIARRVAEYLLG